MINKLLKFSYAVVAVGLLFAQYAWTAPTIEYFVPAPLEPQLSSDGKTLYNAVPPVVYVDDPNPSHELVRIPPPFDLLDLPESALATFSITYVASGGADLWGQSCTTFPEEAKAAFNAAAAVWGNILQSAVPITIKACWADLGAESTTLGYSGGGPWRRDFTGAPLANTWYGGSLANALAGSDLDSSSFDMHITYNSRFSWYYGTDGNTPSTQHDLMSVVLHEIAHGLNFSGSMTYSGGQGSWGDTGYPNIYDTFMRDGSGNRLINTGVYANPSPALGSALTSDNIWFHGSNAMAANGGQRVKIYAPSTWSSGSSYSHLDYTTFNNTANQLMVYAISAGESIHDPGPITIGIFKDLGWNTSGTTCTYSISPTSQSFGSSGGTGSVSVTTQSGCTWTASESLGWVTITSGSSGTGSGTVTYSVSPNTGSSRTGTMTIAGQTFTITQEGAGVTTTNLLKNPGFESGSDNNWTEHGEIIWQNTIMSHSGNWLAWLAGYNYADDYIYQDVSIPSSSTQAYVQFWYKIGTDETESTVYDTMAVQIRRPSDNALLTTLVTLSNLNKSTEWVQSAQYDVSSFKGQTIRLGFYTATDEYLLTDFFVDDTSLTVGQGATGPSNRCDFNGDGKTDILWRNKSTGQNVLWLMNGAAFSSYSLIDAVADTNWQIVGTGDFNGDGKTDILWRNKTTGQNALWFMNGAAFSSYSLIDAVADTNWQIVGTGDFNGDGKTDILWRNKSTGQNVLWLMNGAAFSSYSLIDAVADTNWQIVGTGDFNGDGKTDILWRNKSTGQNVVWLMNGAAFSSYSLIDAVADTNWEIVGTADFNSDGKTDILWRNKSTGQNIVWFMNGTTYSSYAELLQITDTNWEIVGPK
jgi:hypothetical protein